MNTQRLVISTALLVGTGTVCAQAHGELDMGNARARFYAHGLIGQNLANSSAAFEVPNGSGTNTLYSAGLWFAGQSIDNQTKLAAMMYEAAGAADFYPGPLTTDGSATISADMMAAYDQVWTVTRAQVELHMAYFNCLADPGCVLADEFPNGYTIPDAFLTWPALNSEPGYSTYQAPFYDFNLDGDYDPAVGDAPCILGDQALYFVFNDKGGPHLLTNGEPIGLEIQAMPFVYANEGPFLDETVFLHYHIINRGMQPLTQTMIGLFNDFDLGCPDDDFVGTDAARNLTYVYNADDVDQDCAGLSGYEEQPPAFGVAMLKAPLVEPTGADEPPQELLPSWNGTGWGDGTVDNERMGVGHTMSINRNGPSCCNDPAATAHFSNYLNGIWKDGVPQTYDGNGYSIDPDAIPAAFIYPGESDPVGAGTNGDVQVPWTEVSLAVPDRRTISSMGPITLEPGQHIDLLFAYVYARAASGGPLASVSALQARVDSVRAFANELPLWGMIESFQDGCEGTSSVGAEEITTTTALHLFPVPAGDQASFNAPAGFAGASVLIHDATGRIVRTQRVVNGLNTLDVASLAKGVYTCTITSANARYTGRLVKE